MTRPTQFIELQDRVRRLEALVMALGDKMLLLSIHLARLSEKKELRNTSCQTNQVSLKS